MISHFLNYLGSEKRYSPHTIGSYKKDLDDFTEFLFEFESQTDLNKSTKKMIRNYVMQLHKKNFSKRSINRKISSLRSFYNYLLKINEIKSSPMEGVNSLKFYPEKQIGFSVSEMENLKNELENVQKNFDYDAILDRSIIECLYQTGIRKAELCNLNENDVDFANKEFKINGKGNKQRLIPMSENLFFILNEYQIAKNNIIKQVDNFFINKKGKKLNDKFVYSKVNTYLSAVSLKQKKSPHMLRHTFATHLLNSGAEISKVKKILGHSSLASTQVYTEANIETLKKVMNQSHPLGRDTK